LPIELIIFDCDGVLVDSEPLAIQVLVKAIADQGITISLEDAYRDFLGRSLTSISASLHDNHGAPLGASALQSMRTDLYARYHLDLQANPGLPGVLDRLNVPFCVASSSMPERIHLSLDLTGLLHHFAGHIYSASMVENGKPAPDLFLYAANQMQIAPENCLVIEDSPAGITAAQRAGMRVLGYLGGSHAVPGGLRPAITALGPDAIFDDMHTLPDLVRSLGTEKRAR
jgi:HAD superfamily hydrolase (TIGR01509 family)